MQKFFIFLLTVNLASINSASIAFAVSAGTGVTAIANLFIAMTFVLSMVCIRITNVCNDYAFYFIVQLFGGFLIALQSLPNWLQWFKYASFFRYATEVGINYYCVEYKFNCCSPTFLVVMINAWIGCGKVVALFSRLDTNLY